jgi:hypothetical protein
VYTHKRAGGPLARAIVATLYPAGASK